MGSLRFGDFTTPAGHRMDELASWLIKSIRRGLLDDAAFAASEIDEAGYGGYVFRRLAIAAVEDVGLADPLAALVVDVHRRNWLEERKRKDAGTAHRLHLLAAVAYLCNAPKSRMIDHLTIATYEGDRQRQPPTWVYDLHTRTGRAAGADVEQFFDYENGQLANRAPIDDPYEPVARALRTATAARKAGNAHQTPLDLDGPSRR